MSGLKPLTETEQLVISKLRAMASEAPRFEGFTARTEAGAIHLPKRSRLAPLAVAAGVVVIAGVVTLGITHSGPKETSASQPAGSSISAPIPSTAAQTGLHRALSKSEVALAVSSAKGFISRENASVTSATAITAQGTVSDSNTSGQCLSGRLLRIRLIGTFPKIVTTGLPLETGAPQDFTVRAVDLTADATTGSVCLIAVQTGHVTPRPGATPLHLR